MRAIGPEIKIRFADASGLRVGQTPLNYRGVQVGEVIGIDLTEDRRQAVVKVRLLKSAAPLATEGTQFWIVRPQIGLNQVTGLSTVLSGPEINCCRARARPCKRNSRAWTTRRPRSASPGCASSCAPSARRAFASVRR
jgi:paraquat-inducible protein B